ncbi:MAG: hypothetical protein KJO98_14890 [Rhodothermia bacterium]|nr:hypothetical protein [Rhodothermia bacterium]
MRLPSRFGLFRSLQITIRAAILCVLISGYSITSLDALGQSAFDGVTYVVDWPENRPPTSPGQSPPPLDYSAYSLLPFVDTLAVHYDFSDSLGLPSMRFAIEWTAADVGILRGRKVSNSRMPERVVIESIDLLMPVVVRGGVVAELFLPLDTLGLGEVPSITFVDISNTRWDSVFVETGAEDARAIFRSGFRLGTPRILRVVFGVEQNDESMRASQRRYPPTAPPERTVCIPDIDIWISWRDGRRRWAPPPGAISKATSDRRNEIGRTGLVDRTRVDRGYDRPARDAIAEGTRGTDEDGESAGDSDSDSPDKASSGRDRRTGRSGGDGIGDLIKPKNDDDDDDDDDRLYPAALAGAAAVGGIAIFGGTVGYFGSGSKAPIGLMSGYVEPNGGFLLQVAINEQVFGRARGPENLIAGVTGFYDAFRSPLQPAIGIGARFTEEGTDEVRSEPSVSFGLVGNFGPWLVLAAYDVTTPDFRFGVAINFRQMR